MKAAVVKGPGSNLHGKKCTASFCRRPVRQGEAVVWRKMPNDSYDEPLFVTHTACMQTILDAAPEGSVTPGNHAVRAAAIARVVAETGELFPATV